jgi:hypothetical protein
MARAPFDGAIAERAHKTLGLLTIAQLDSLGVARQHRRTLVVRGTLVPVARGVFRHAAWPRSWQQNVLAAVLAVGDAAVASHMTAAALWRLDLVRPGAIEVTVPRGRHPACPLAIVHRSRDLLVADVDPHGSIPRTTAARTLLDIAPLVDEPRLEAALDHVGLKGWRVVPFICEDVTERPDHVVAMIRSYLRLAAA